MTTIAIIPARMGSSRFPGKPIATLLGRPMVEHVYKRTALAGGLDAVVVATCDDEIATAVARFGGRAVMTSAAHQRASDRVAEAARYLDADIVVMVQGDEPMVRPEMIEEALAPMQRDRAIRCVNLVKRITSLPEFENRNTIKVVMDAAGRALYFSRQPIPDRPQGAFAAIAAYKQVCIMPFRAEALAAFAALAPTPLEVAESVDMMRFLEHGHPVHMVETHVETHAVDTADDLAAVEKLMRTDPLSARY